MQEDIYTGGELTKMLWEAADTLRSNMDASEYKQVFLGLISELNQVF